MNRNNEQMDEYIIGIKSQNMKYNTARIFCIGRNYAEHANELGSEIPKSPVVFIKPISCLVDAGEKVKYPKHGNNLHHEIELVIRIGKTGQPEKLEDAFSFIDAFTIGLDLTLRDIQNKLKDKGLPWEMSKAFEQSAPIGKFVKYDNPDQLHNFTFRCFVNNIKCQEGNSNDMIFSVERLIFELGKIWVLQPGDLIYTGTPSGVGSLNIGDTVIIENEITGSFSWAII